MLVPAHAQDDDQDNNFIVAGQPIFIIVIGEYCGIPNNLGEREIAELKKNFESLNPKIRYAWISREPLTFDNHKHSTIDFDNDEEGKGCVRVAYWDGKKTSVPLLYDDLVGATEYFSPKLLKKKVESSYYTEFQKRLKHYQQKKEHLTSRSKEVSDRYVKDVLINQGLMGGSPVFPMNLKGVKRITVKENNEVQMRLYLNEEGLLSRIERQDGKTYMECKYEEGLLRALVDHTYQPEPKTTAEYLYNDNEIFEKVVKEETPPYDGKHFYYTCDYYQLQDDFVNRYRVGFSTDTWSINENTIKKEGNQIIDEDDLNKTVYTLSDTKNYLPITMEFGKEEDKSKGKLFQKNPLLWVFESDSRLNKFYWDKQGRIIKMVAKRNDMQEIEDVTYYFQYEMY
jgi:hypothetical protein